jgi:hypothetical protein
MVKRLTQAAIACVTGVAATVLAAAPAQAWPGDCSTAFYSSTATLAVCHSGSGSYRAVAFCEFPDGTAGAPVGSWKTVASNSYSYAFCENIPALGGQSYVFAKDVNKRSY